MIQQIIDFWSKEPKLCIDCKNAKIETYSYLNIRTIEDAMAANSDYLIKCRRPIKISSVTGRVEYNDYSCKYERSTSDYCCGPKAKFFEAKV